MSKWREKYKVHPAADLFPLMSDEELRVLGEDIKANGLKHSPCVDEDGLLIDGRSRLEAMERLGIDPCSAPPVTRYGDAVANIISLNVHRRHLTKQQIADLLVADAIKGNLLTVEEVSKGGRGKINEVKAAVVAKAQERGISESTVERALAKVTPQRETKRLSGAAVRRAYSSPLKMNPKPEAPPGIDTVRRCYVEAFARLGAAEREAEFEVLMDEIKGLTGKPPAHAVAENYPELPACLDRRRNKEVLHTAK